MKFFFFVLLVSSFTLLGCSNDATERGTDYTSQLRERASKAQTTTPAQMAGRMEVTQSIPLSPEDYKEFGRISARVHRAIDGGSWQEGHAHVQALFAALPDDDVTSIGKASGAMDMLSRRFATIDSLEKAEAAAYYVDLIAHIPGVQAAVANRALLAAEPYLAAERFREVARRLIAASDALDAENAAATTSARPLTPDEQRDEAVRVQTLDALRAHLAD